MHACIRLSKRFKMVSLTSDPATVSDGVVGDGSGYYNLHYTGSSQKTSATILVGFSDQGGVENTCCLDRLLAYGFTQDNLNISSTILRTD